MTDNPWTSLQDALLLSGGMVVAIVLALEYDLFRFGEELTSEERRITLAELMFLTLLLAAGIVVFVLRRLYESRSEAAREASRNLEMQALKDQAQRDPVTGLLNGRGLLAALGSAISEADGAHQRALLLMGLHGMERVNDLNGRAVGDGLLRIIVERIRAAAQPNDIMARLDGGSELALIAYDVNHDEAEALAQRLIAALETDLIVEQDPQKIGLSIGATMIRSPRLTPAEILNAADLAMRRAKEPHQPALVFYDAPGTPRQS
jgi:diguanylate cyclase (GGDEF)-like protein